MPLAFLIVGALIIVTAYQGTYKDFGNQLVKDFSGSSGNFIYWIAAVAIVGMLGYVKIFRTPSRMFLALIILAFILANRGVFAQLQQALGNIIPDTNKVVEPSLPGPLPVTISGGGGGIGGLFGGVTKLFGGGSSATGATTSAAATGGL